MQQAISETTPATPAFIAEIEESEWENDARVYKWTRQEYYRMAELGFFDGRRVELIEGEIFEMTPMKSPHATSLGLASDVLSEVFGKKYHVREQLPISFGKNSDPEPDIAVVAGGRRDYKDQHPKTADLIVEISDATLRYDRTTKAQLYAKNKIQDFWIVNVKKRCVEVYRQPKKDKKLGFIYTEARIFTEDDALAPLAAPGAKIKVADLLP